MKRVIFILLCLTLGFANMDNLHDSATPPRSNSEVTALDHDTDLSLPLQMAVSETIGRDNAAYHIDRLTYTASNPTHGYDVAFGEQGVTISQGHDLWQLQLTSYGYGDHSIPATRAAREHVDNRVTYQRGILDEWYVNGQMGLQQGFTLHQAPTAHRTGELFLTMTISGTMSATLHGDTLVLKGENGAGLTYGGLYAYDANGLPLPARFRHTGDELAILVDDSLAVYPLTIDPWVQQAKLTASDGAPDDFFGNAVATDGDTALVGARLDDDNGMDSGSAYVFVRSGANWSLQAKLLPADGATHDNFGWSVALSGNSALIGSPGDDDNGDQSGSAYVFVRSGTTWTQQDKLLPADGTTDDVFGYAVAIDGQTALIGDQDGGSSGDNSGSGYVFVRSGTSWTQQAKLLPADGAPYDFFGRSVALSGDTALVGASGDADNGTNSGSAYVFARAGTTWTQQSKLLPADGSAYDFFGQSVALSGDTALVGAYWDSDNGEVSGSAYVFVRSGTTWAQQVKLLPADGDAHDNFGWSVALVGDRALIGSPYDKDNGPSSGSAYIFARAGTTWTQQAKLLPADGAADDDFGWSVALASDTALVGAFLDDDHGMNSGSAYVFFFTPDQSLIAGAMCNGPDLAVTISVGDGPFNITASAGINTPVNGIGIGTTTISGPEKWDNLTVTETTGDTESINLGKFKCRTAERPVPISPAHRSRTTNPFPLFSWTPISIANNYRVFIFDNKVATDRTVDIRQNSGGPTSMILSLPLPDGRLFWRVRGRQNRVWSLWSIRFTLFKDPVVPFRASTPLPTIDLNPTTLPDSVTAVPLPTFPPPPNSR